MADKSLLEINKFHVDDYLISKKIGIGSYGSIYLGYNKEKTCAIKVIPVNKDGITCLLECSILSTYEHNYLNRCFCIISDSINSKLWQETAISDLSDATANRPQDEKRVKKWFHQISQAISLLWKENIIHCDIKPHNILLYEDDNIKLTDFTLSILKINNTDKYKITTCTLQYRAPEILTGEGWNEMVDIWALGCTIYEIATGKNLVVYQDTKLPKTNNEKLQLRSNTFRAIVHWRKTEGDIIKPKYIDRISTYIPVKYHESWEILSPDLRVLILKMTNFLSTERPSIDKILNDKYFYGMERLQYKINSKNTVDISEVEKKLLSDIAINNKLGDSSNNINAEILKRATDIYSRCKSMKIFDKLAVAETSYWIASKLILGEPSKKNITKLHIILDIEIKICDHLNYQLHVYSTNNLYIAT